MEKSSRNVTNRWESDKTRKSYRASVAQCKVSAYAPSCRTLRCDVLERADTAVTKLQISPLIVNGFKNGFHQRIQRIFLVVVEAERNFFRIFFGFQNVDPLYRPVAGKPFVLEDLSLGMGTSVACALSAKTIFEIIKCMSDVDICVTACAWGQNPKFSGFCARQRML